MGIVIELKGIEKKREGDFYPIARSRLEKPSRCMSS